MRDLLLQKIIVGAHLSCAGWLSSARRAKRRRTRGGGGVRLRNTERSRKKGEESDGRANNYDGSSGPHTTGLRDPARHQTHWPPGAAPPDSREPGHRRSIPTLGPRRGPAGLSRVLLGVESASERWRLLGRRLVSWLVGLGILLRVTLAAETAGCGCPGSGTGGNA